MALAATARKRLCHSAARDACAGVAESMKDMALRRMEIKRKLAEREAIVLRKVTSHVELSPMLTPRGAPGGPAAGSRVVQTPESDAERKSEIERRRTLRLRRENPPPPTEAEIITQREVGDEEDHMVAQALASEFKQCFVRDAAGKRAKKDEVNTRALLPFIAEQRSAGKKVGRVTYSKAINACVSSLSLQEAQRIYDDMVRNNVKPTLQTLNSLMIISARTQHIEELWDFYKEMTKFGLKGTPSPSARFLSSQDRCADGNK
eukprot:gene11966-18469_t